MENNRCARSSRDLEVFCPICMGVIPFVVVVVVVELLDVAVVVIGTYRLFIVAVGRFDVVVFTEQRLVDGHCLGLIEVPPQQLHH